MDFLINSYLYYYTGTEFLVHELEESKNNPFNKYECLPI